MRVGTLVLFALLSGTPVAAQTSVPLQAGAPVDGYLLRPSDAGPHPAIVFLHGCGGLWTPSHGLVSRERDWADRFVARGYIVLLVDSFTRRGVRQMCSPRTFNAAVFNARIDDVEAALRYLQAQPFVLPDRIALMGWSEGGGVVLRAVSQTTGFRVAVAFYPARCNRSQLGPRWRSTIPLLILVGDGDVWTPAAPCRRVVAAATAGAPVTFQSYPGAYHDFDWPNDPVHELSAYRTSSGVVPIAGTDPAARADALDRVPAFLQEMLGS